MSIQTFYTISINIFSPFFQTWLIQDHNYQQWSQHTIQGWLSLSLPHWQRFFFAISNILPSRPLPDVQTLYQNSILNCPGKTIVVFQITFPPNGSMPPHTHAGAYISANILSGYVLNKMNDNPMEILGPGQFLLERPTCRHKICENASTTEPAVFVATFVVDTKVVDEVGIEGLVVIDEEYRQ